MTPTEPTLFGQPVAVLAFFVSIVGFVIALIALVWQFVSYFLDGGRVKVSLNVAVLCPEFSLWTNTSGRFLIKNDSHGREVTTGQALELAQLVVENPGRTPLTILAPGLSVRGSGHRRRSFTPRLIPTERLGADSALTDMTMRLEPYDRVTFLFDYWSSIPSTLKESKRGRIAMRGCVNVAGKAHTKKSSLRRQWIFTRDTYTAIEGSPKFTPYAVLWHDMYCRLPEKQDPDLLSSAARQATRGLAGALLENAMLRFDEQPDQEAFDRALREEAKKMGVEPWSVGLVSFFGYQALDRMRGHLTPWTERLFGPRPDRKRAVPASDAQAQLPNEPEPEDTDRET